MTEARTTADGGMETSYGFHKVDEGQKQGMVNEVFHKVAKRYDIMNDVMSAGMHRVWKDAMIRALNPRKDPSYKTLDVAGGTGDIAFRIIRASIASRIPPFSISTARCWRWVKSGLRRRSCPTI